MTGGAAGLALCLATFTVYLWAVGVGDGVSPAVFAVIALGLVVPLAAGGAVVGAMATGRWGRLQQVLLAATAALLVAAAVGAAAGV